MNVSACLIIKNEEKNLERCLESLLPFAGEIIIVDTGSTDKSKEIASKFTNKILILIGTITLQKQEISVSVKPQKNLSFQLMPMNMLKIPRK